MSSKLGLNTALLAPVRASWRDIVERLHVRVTEVAKNGESLLGVELVRQVHAHLLEDNVVEREQLAHICTSAQTR